MSREGEARVKEELQYRSTLSWTRKPICKEQQLGFPRAKVLQVVAQVCISVDAATQVDAAATSFPRSHPTHLLPAPRLPLSSGEGSGRRWL
jgi:hypothetical protein